MTKRMLQAVVELDNAERNWKRLERESQKERRMVPNHLRDQHMAEISLCKRNIAAAEAAEYAMNRFPPVGLYR